MTDPQTTTAPVLQAGLADVESVADVLAAAFAEDPVVAWCMPDPARRRLLAPGFFRVVVEANVGSGEVYSLAARPGDADRGAAAVWTPPGVGADPAAEEELFGRLSAAAGDAIARIATVFGLMEEVHPLEEHAYLHLLGTRPEHQSRGLGSVLMCHVLDRCDADGTPAYLEATSEGSRRLYLRHGFADVGLIELPDGPPLWRMWREPSS